MESDSSIDFSFDKPSILLDADQYIRKIFNYNNDNRLLLHNYAMVDEIVKETQTLLEQHSDNQQTEAILLAAYFLLTGYWDNYKNPIEGSLKQASSFLSKSVYPDTNAVLGIINEVFNTDAPQSEGASILSDAKTICIYIKNYTTNHSFLRIERELILGENHDRLSWAKVQMDELLKQRLHTAFAQKTYQNQLSASILLQKNRIEKEKRTAPSLALTSVENPLFKGLDNRSIHTFFRANYRNHINLSAIADKKANIMISVNSIVISMLITFISYRNIAATNPMILIPVILFLVTGLASLIFAVLSARPKVTMVNKDKKNEAELKKNIVFFGNFIHLSLPQFEKALDEVFREEDLLVGNMARDLYFLGKVLDRKYRFLTISYNVFMIGFIATVLMFMLILLR